MIGAILAPLAPYRAWLVLAAAAALLGAGGWVGYRVGAYGAAREAQDRLNEALSERDGAIAERDRLAGIDARVALAMAQFRGDLAAHAGALQASIDSAPLSREVRYVLQDGSSVTCDRRDPARYRELWNAAVSGGTPPAAAAGGVPGPVPR